MKTGIRAVLALLMLAMAAAPLPGLATMLTPYKATYNLSYTGFYVGEAVYELQIDSDGYVLFSARAEPKGLASFFTSDIVTEQSRLRIDDDGALVALRYDYAQERSRRIIEEKSVEFDWQAGRAQTRINGDIQHVEIENGTVDRMSLQLKVMADRLAGKEDKELVYQVVEDHELREYAFEVKERARITTEAGVYDTIRLERQHGSRTTIFWSAPSLGYLPVRVEQRRTGHATSSMDLKTLRIRDRTSVSR
jgi:hypothetical protein